jgi:hypothetical protein
MKVRSKSATRAALFVLVATSVNGCANDETMIAQTARTSLVGMSELNLETCLGIPDHSVTEGKTTLFTYTSTAARTLNLSVPVVNGIGVSFSGNCRATFRLDNGHVTSVSYGGDTYGFEGPDSACAAIVRGCVRHAT